MAEKLIVILGPTASGKTQMAARLAHDLKGEIISADSRQIYRNMNIGTGKDLEQYVVDGKCVPCHLIDIVDPENEFNLFEFQRRFFEVFHDLSLRRIVPVLAGGTGLYLESVLKGYDMPHAPANGNLREELNKKSKEELREILLGQKPHLHNRTDLDDKDRMIRAIEIERARKISKHTHRDIPEMDALVFGIRLDRAQLRRRILIRLDERLKQGMVEEVANLHSSGLSWERLDSFGLEYRFIARYLQDKMTFEEMKKRLHIAIGQFAKRQETWFRRMEKKGIAINWLGTGDYHKMKESVVSFLG